MFGHANIRFDLSSSTVCHQLTIVLLPSTDARFAKAKMILSTKTIVSLTRQLSSTVSWIRFLQYYYGLRGLYVFSILFTYSRKKSQFVLLLCSTQDCIFLITLLLTLIIIGVSSENISRCFNWKICFCSLIEKYDLLVWIPSVGVWHYNYQQLNVRLGFQRKPQIVC